MHNGGQPKYTPACQLSTMRNHISADHSLVNEVKDRIADLTHLIACVLRYNRFYDQLLDDKLPSSLNGIHLTTSRNVSLVPLVGSYT
jgi:hypothetical protein